MRTRLIVCFSLLIGLILGCNDGITPTPGSIGYIWEVRNDYFEDITGTGYKYFDIEKYDVIDGKDVGGYRGDFDIEGYEAAWGDGRLWVSIDSESEEFGYGFFIWASDGKHIPFASRGGLTYDGDYLWNSTGSDFYRINPNTFENELMFIYGDGSLSFNSLAWDGEYLWGLVGSEAEVIQIDPETGSKVHSVPCPGIQRNGLTWGAGSLWVNDDGGVYRFSPKDGSVIDVFYTEGGDWARGLAFEPPSE